MVAELFKSLCQIELFFKWIKQLLRIKHFYGSSFNTEKSQIPFYFSPLIPLNDGRHSQQCKFEGMKALISPLSSLQKIS